MLDHLRRRPAALLFTALLPLSLALTACGEDDSTLEGFDAVSISGAVGSTPELDWKGTLKADTKPTSKVVTEGDGPKIAEGDVVQVNLTLANGFTQEVNFDSYDKFSLSALVKVGEDVQVTDFTGVVAQGVSEAIKPGQTIGSRVALTLSSEKLLADYGGSEAALQLFADENIGNEDGLLFIADLTALAGPSGTDQKVAPGVPKVIEKDGVPSGFDFKGAAAPSGKLKVTTLVKGTGPVVKSGQQILASYLGSVSKGAKPFDESYSKGSALPAIVGGKGASVVKGWSQGLVGLPVGTRVLLEIPPNLGYGKEAQKDAEGKVTIPANSTLYFVIDILDVADVEPAPTPDPTPTPSPSATPSKPASPKPSESASR